MNKEFDSDPLDAARGCVYSIPLGIFLWAILITIVLWATGCVTAHPGCGCN